jgi:hypothetical protein
VTCISTILWRTHRRLDRAHRLSIKGVISFSIFEEKAVVRAIIGEQELLKSIREITGLVFAPSLSNVFISLCLIGGAGATPQLPRYRSAQPV